MFKTGQSLLSSRRLQTTDFHDPEMAPSNSSPTFIATSEGDLTPALVIAAGAVLPILGIIAVALRFTSRLQRKDVRLGADDWLILVSIVRSHHMMTHYPR